MRVLKWNLVGRNVLWILNPFLLVISFFNKTIHFGIYFQWLGKMHPLLLHFPIVLSSFIGLYYILDKKSSISNAVLKNILLVNALLSSLVAILGILLSKQDSYDAQTIFLHQWGGVGIAFISWFFVFAQDGITGFLNNYRWRLLSGSGFLIVLFIFTHKGAQLTHGVNVINFPDPAPSEKSKLSTTKLDSNATIYAKAIAPILEQKCISCHGKDKVKGDLLLNTPENILKGGKDGSILASDKDKEAILFTRMHLPMSDEKHMPPDGKMQLTSEEVALLGRWIKAGGDFKTKLKEIAKTDSLFILATNYTPTFESDNKKPAKFPDLKQYNSDYCTVYYLYNGSNEVAVNFYQPTFYSIDHLKKLEKIAPQIISLNMQAMPLTKNDLAIIGKFENIEKLNLNYTKLKFEDLSALTSLKKLATLSVCGFNFNDQKVDNFLSSSKVSRLNIWSTNFNDKLSATTLAKYAKVSILMGDNLQDQIISLSNPIIEQDSSIMVTRLKVSVKNYVKGAEMRYTIDGSMPDSLLSPIYKMPVFVNSSCEFKVKAFKVGWLSSEVVQRTFYKSELQPDTVYFAYPSSNRYIGTGAKTIADLELGDLNKGNKKWLGAKDTSMEIVIGFKKIQPLHQARFNTLIDISAFIFPMESMVVSGSNDGKKFTPIGKIKYKDDIKPGMLVSQTKSFEFPTNTQYKFYKFKLNNLMDVPRPIVKILKPDASAGKKIAWVFVDELFLN